VIAAQAGPGQSYSDVILRLEAVGTGPDAQASVIRYSSLGEGVMLNMVWTGAADTRECAPRFHAFRKRSMENAAMPKLPRPGDLATSALA
jgi:hypothetical protein